MYRTLSTLSSLLIFGLTFAGCSKPATTPSTEVRPVRTETIALTRGGTDSLFSGEIRARQESHLGFKVSGKVIDRLVQPGDQVVAGQALLRLDPQDAALSEESALAQTEAALIKLRQSDIDLQRYAQLHQEGFISKAALDQYRLAQDTAASQLRSARAQQRLSANQRHYTVLSADRAGVVTAIDVEVGQVVSAGQQVLTLAAEGEREVLISIPEARVDELRRADTLTVTAWAYPQRSYEGRLRELAPDSDKATRTYAARVTLVQPDPQLLLGMTASVRVRIAGDTPSAHVPLSALHHHAGKAQVWIVAPQTFTVSARPVRVGSPEQGRVRIIEGLRAGEVVVTAGVHLLQPGLKVRPVSSTLLPERGS